MSAVHLHLLLNHVPVIGTLIGVALLVLALLRRSEEIAGAALMLFVGVGLASAVVFFTGEPAEEAVEKLAGVSTQMLESHEEAATVAAIASGMLGALALGVLLAFRSRSMPRGLTLAALVLAIAVGGIMGWTANLGGQIRHTEISGAATPAGDRPGSETKDD